MSAVRIFIVVGEHSGDRLGGKLIEALRERAGGPLSVAGVGGEDMEAAGLSSIFPMSDIAVMGLSDVLKRLPDLLRRIRRTADAALAFDPDAVVIIDSPDFTHRVARRVRRTRPDVPIIDYVSPTVWAWRPGRARKMAAYVDHVLALLPFEPEAHKRLGGPPCTFVGHPIVERQDWIGALEPGALRQRLGLVADRPVLVVLPGSRVAEVGALMPIFGEAIRQIESYAGPLELVLPLVTSVEHHVEQGLAGWSRRPHIVRGDADKFASFRLADAALAASGTVTLELAAVGTPMAVAYLAKGINTLARPFIRVPSIVLANLVLGRNAFPEFIQEHCTAGNLATALLPLLSETPERRAQLEALAEIPARLAPPASSPSVAAAEVVLTLARRDRGTP